MQILKKLCHPGCVEGLKLARRTATVGILSVLWGQHFGEARKIEKEILYCTILSNLLCGIYIQEESVCSVCFCVPKGLYCALIVVPLCWYMPKPNTIFLRKKHVILWLPKQRGLFSSTGWKPQRCAKKRSFTSWGAWKGWTWCIWGVVTLRVPFLRVFPPFSLLVFAVSYGWNPIPLIQGLPSLRLTASLPWIWMQHWKTSLLFGRPEGPFSQAIFVLGSPTRNPKMVFCFCVFLMGDFQMNHVKIRGSNIKSSSTINNKQH